MRVNNCDHPRNVVHRFYYKYVFRGPESQLNLGMSPFLMPGLCGTMIGACPTIQQKYFLENNQSFQRSPHRDT